MSDLKKVQEVLCQFVIDAATDRVYDYHNSKAQLIPEVTMALVELAKLNQLHSGNSERTVSVTKQPLGDSDHGDCNDPTNCSNN